MWCVSGLVVLEWHGHSRRSDVKDFCKIVANAKCCFKTAVQRDKSSSRRIVNMLLLMKSEEFA